MIAGSGDASWSPPATWWNIVKGAAPRLGEWLPSPMEMAQGRGGPNPYEYDLAGGQDAETQRKLALRREQLARQTEAARDAYLAAKAAGQSKSDSEIVLRGIGNLVKTVGQLGAQGIMDMPPMTSAQGQEFGANIAEAVGPAGQFAQYAQIAQEPRGSMKYQPVETTLAGGGLTSTALRVARAARAVRAAGRGADAVGDVARSRIPDLDPMDTRTTPPPTPTAAAVAAVAPNSVSAPAGLGQRMARAGRALKPVGAALSQFDVSTSGAMTGAILGSAVGAPYLGAALGAAAPMAGKLVGKLSPVLGRAIGAKAAAARQTFDDYRAQPDDEPAIEAVVQNVTTEPVRIGREMQGSTQQAARVIRREGMELDPATEFDTPQVQSQQVVPITREAAEKVGLDRVGESVDMVEPPAATKAGAGHAAQAIDLQADLVATTDMLSELRELRKVFQKEAEDATRGQTQRLNDALAELRKTTDPARKRVLLDEIKATRKDRAMADPTVSPEYKKAQAAADAAEANLRRKIHGAKVEREAAIGGSENANTRLAKIKAARDALYVAAKQAREAHGVAQAAFEKAVAEYRAKRADAAKNLKSAAGYQRMVKPDKDTVSARIQERIGKEAQAEQLARDTAWAEAKSKQLGDIKKLKVELLKEEYRASVRRWSDDASRGKAVGNKAEYWKRDKPAAEARVRDRIKALQAEREAAYAKAKTASEAYKAKANEVYKKAKADDPDIAEYDVAKKEMDDAVAAYKASADRTQVTGALDDARSAYGQRRLAEARAKGASESVRDIADKMKAEREARWQAVKDKAAEREAAFAAKKAATGDLANTTKMRPDVAEADAGLGAAREGVDAARDASKTGAGQTVDEARRLSGQDVVTQPAGKRPVFPLHPILRRYVDKVTEYSNRYNPNPFAAEEIAREFSSLSQIDTPGIFRDPQMRGAVATRLIAKRFGLDDRKLPRRLPDGSSLAEEMTKLSNMLYDLAETQMRGAPKSLVYAGTDALSTAKAIFDGEFTTAKRNKSMSMAAEQYGKVIANKLQEENQARMLHAEVTRALPPLGDIGKEVHPTNAVAYAAAKELLGDAPHTALWASLGDIRAALANPGELIPLVQKWAKMTGQTVDDAQIAAQLKKMAQRWTDGVPMTGQHPIAEFLQKGRANGSVPGMPQSPVTILPGANTAYVSRITTAEALANIVKVSTAWDLALARISRSSKFGMTSGNLAAFVNNISGNLGQNLVTRGLDPVRWGYRLAKAVKQQTAWRNGTASAEVMRKWEAINRTGVTKAPAFDLAIEPLKSGWKKSTIGKAAEKAHDFVTRMADEAYQTFGDRAFKAEAASSRYDDLMANAEGMQVGRAADWNLGDGRAARVKMVERNAFRGWTINGKSATIDDISRLAARSAAAFAQEMFVDVERTGTLTQSIRRSNVTSIASPFVTWANRARPTPYQRGFLGDALLGSDSPILWTNDPGTVSAMAAQGMETAAMRASLANLARQQPGTPEALADAYSWGDGPGAVGVWRDDESHLFVKNFDQGSAFSPTASLFRLGMGAQALMDSFVSSAPDDLFVTIGKNGMPRPIDRKTLTPEQRAQRARWSRVNSRSGVSEKTVLSFLNAAGGPVSTMWSDIASGKGVDPKKVGMTLAAMFTGAVPFAAYDIGTSANNPSEEVRARYLGNPMDNRQEAESIINYSLRRAFGMGIKPDIPEDTLANVLEIRKRALRKSMGLMTADKINEAQARIRKGEDVEYWKKKVYENRWKEAKLEAATRDVEMDIEAISKRMREARKVKGKAGWINLAPAPAP